MNVHKHVKLLPKNLRAILACAFALMTLIPLLLIAFLMQLEPRSTAAMTRFLTIIIAVTMSSGLFGLWLLVRVIRSISALAVQAKMISERREIQKIEYYDEDSEIGTIVTSFNAVMGRLGQKIQELEKVNGELEFLSITDELTGLYNFRSFKEFLEREVARSQRKGYSLTLIMLDLDDFKIFNDQHGHAAGNEYLKSVASTLQNAVRRYDIVARYGGDEFAVILPETDEEKGGLVAQRLRETLNAVEVVTGKGTHHPVSVSMGMASRRFGKEEPAGNLPGLVEEADQALYRAKKQGKGFLETYRRAS